MASAKPKTRETTLSETDVANAERLLALYGADLRYVTEWGLWMYYQGGRWVLDSERSARVRHFAKRTAQTLAGEARARLAALGKAHQGHDKTCKDCVAARRGLKWAHDSQFAARITAMVQIAADDPSIAISHARLDADPLLFNVANGTIDLRTGKLRGHSRLDLLTKQAPVTYAASSKALRWGTFLKRVLPEDATRSFVQRFLGYALSGEAGERMFVVLYGGGRNGKSLLLRAVEETLGDYATTAAPSLLMAKQQESHPTEVADLFKVRLAVSSEIKKGRTFDEELVKRITGNDTLKARRMKENFWSFQPSHKIVVATNHKPKVRDASDSFWDRLALVEFGVRIQDREVDAKLLEKLRKERSGILMWLLQGWAAYRREGLKRPEAVAEATKAYRFEEDRLGQFLMEECIFGGDEPTRTKDLIAAAVVWCKDRNFHPFNPNEMAERLRDQNCKPTRIGHYQDRGWSAIKLRKTKSARPLNKSADVADSADTGSRLPQKAN